MNVPVLITARNEAGRLAGTLDALPADCQPVVIPNGCTDDTRAVAVAYGESGVRVVDCEEEGKMLALQAGLRSLGRTALESPFIILDAHNRPLFSKSWIPAMLRSRGQVDPTSPAVAVGLGLYVDGPSLAANAMHTIGQWRRQRSSRFDPCGGYFYGFNMLVDVAGRRDLLEDILGLPNYWPGEDEAIKDVVVDSGGNTIKAISLLAMVTFPSRRQVGVVDRLRLGGHNAGQRILRSYLEDAPPNSTPYPRRASSGVKAAQITADA